MEGYIHITMFDEQYTPEKQAEGIAISQAVVDGHCYKCGFFRNAPHKMIFNSPHICVVYEAQG